ncbi:hypothetical protein [Pseudoalteromonas sp. MMG005]|uniref:hypothetical protein n=1 Tax=Pseudoalteromonas sp. MMG005 TaxID=2822682 RepID=UPI001B39EE56|nr:hypothetical protein [Pseudoalteromonas sp. MMG005]MBQ4844725.1 hypothetical protein [Pseudoalteromonas sp. MMG005]
MKTVSGVTTGMGPDLRQEDNESGLVLVSYFRRSEGVPALQTLRRSEPVSESIV